MTELPRHASDAEEACCCSPDCRAVLWHGVPFKFTATQAAVVKVLWDAWRQGTPDVGVGTLQEMAGFEIRIPALFRHRRGNQMVPHRALGVMLVPGATKGSWRLAGLPPKEGAQRWHTLPDE